MNSVEFFAGSRSFTKCAQSLGYACFTTDKEKFEGIDCAVDIREFDVNQVPFIPSVIWASPPCTGFSVAAIGRNWDLEGGRLVAVTPSAILGASLVLKTLQIISHFQKQNPNLLWFLENPLGALRKLDFMAPYLRRTVTYCQYGDPRMKPTDIWTNTLLWHPRPPCTNGDRCHEAAPRGSRRGTQGMKDAYERSRVPRDLCMEILRDIGPVVAMNEDEGEILPL